MASRSSSTHALEGRLVEKKYGALKKEKKKYIKPNEMWKSCCDGAAPWGCWQSLWAALGSLGPGGGSRRDLQPRFDATRTSVPAKLTVGIMVCWPPRVKLP